MEIRMNVYTVDFHMKKYREDADGNFVFMNNGPSMHENVVAQSQDQALQELRDLLDTDTQQVEIEHVGNGAQNALVSPPASRATMPVPPEYPGPLTDATAQQSAAAEQKENETAQQVAAQEGAPVVNVPAAPPKPKTEAPAEIPDPAKPTIN